MTVLVTLRGDCFDRMVEQMPDGSLLPDAVVPAVPLSSADLAAAASRPSQGVGVTIEPELVAQIVADMTDQPGSLPLFEYALTELFDAHTSPTLTRATYRALGGLQGALARRAEATFCALEPGEQEAAHQVFLRLVDVSDLTETRRRVDRAELESIGEGTGPVTTALDAFDRARLLTFDRNPVSGVPTVEVAHEALLHAWPRLRRWLDEAHDDLRLHRSLSEEVDEWERAGRAGDYLIGGARLAQFEAWPTEGAVTPTQPELAFLDASRARRDAAAIARRRSHRRLQGLVAVASVAAVLAAGLAWVAADRGQAAEASERTAHARELANASLSVVDGDPEVATLLALESIDVTRPDGAALPEAETALHAAVTANRLVSGFPGSWQAAFTSGGDLLVGGTPAHVVDPATGQDIVTLPRLPDGLEVESVAVSIDGTLATGTDGDFARLLLYDQDGTELRELHSARYGTAHGDTIGPLEFSPDGSMLASLAPLGGGLTLWDTATGDLLSTHVEGSFSGASPITVDVAFSPDGTLLAVGRDDVVLLLDLTTGDWRGIQAAHEGLTNAVAFIGDGSSIATAGWDGTIQVHDVASGRLLATTDATSGQIVAMRPSPDRARLVTGSDSGTVQLWDVTGSTVVPGATLAGLRDAALSVAFDASGTRVAAIGFDGAAVWDVRTIGPGETRTWVAAGPAVFSPDGRLVASVDESGRHVEVLSTATWEVAQTVTDVATPTGQVSGVDISPNGSTLATTTIEDVEPGRWGHLELWDIGSGTRRATIFDHPLFLGGVTFSDDGQYLAVPTCGSPGSAGGVWSIEDEAWEVILYDQPCGQSLALTGDAGMVAVDTELEDQPNVLIHETRTGDVVTAVSHAAMWRGGLDFSPDDSRLVSGGVDGTARVWDVATGERLLTLTGHTGPVEDVAYTPDGRRVVTASSDGTVRIWDADTGEMHVVLSGHADFADVSVSPDGRYLLTSDGSVARVWALDVEELAQIARARLTRGLTPAECRTYHVEDCS